MLKELLVSIGKSQIIKAICEYLKITSAKQIKIVAFTTNALY